MTSDDINVSPESLNITSKPTFTVQPLETSSSLVQKCSINISNSGIGLTYQPMDFTGSNFTYELTVPLSVDTYNVSVNCSDNHEFTKLSVKQFSVDQAYPIFDIRIVNGVSGVYCQNAPNGCTGSGMTAGNLKTRFQIDASGDAPVSQCQVNYNNTNWHDSNDGGDSYYALSLKVYDFYVFQSCHGSQGCSDPEKFDVSVRCKYANGDWAAPVTKQFVINDTTQPNVTLSVSNNGAFCTGESGTVTATITDEGGSGLVDCDFSDTNFNCQDVVISSGQAVCNKPVSSLGSVTATCTDNNSNTGTSPSEDGPYTFDVFSECCHSDGWTTCTSPLDCCGGYCLNGYCSSNNYYCGNGLCENPEVDCPSSYTKYGYVSCQADCSNAQVTATVQSLTYHTDCTYDATLKYESTGCVLYEVVCDQGCASFSIAQGLYICDDDWHFLYYLTEKRDPINGCPMVKTQTLTGAGGSCATTYGVEASDYGGTTDTVSWNANRNRRRPDGTWCCWQNDCKSNHCCEGLPDLDTCRDWWFPGTCRECCGDGDCGDSDGDGIGEFCFDWNCEELKPNGASKWCNRDTMCQSGHCCDNACSSESCPTGCPHIYSWNGTDYQFEHESLLGVFNKRMETTKYDRLDYLAPREGILSLNIGEERNEVSYLDRVGLIAVDHPEGTEVIMDAFGSVHTLSNVLPVKCVDETGDDCTFEVSDRDAMPLVRKLHEQGGMIQDTDYKGKAWEGDVETDGMRTWVELTLPETDAKLGKLIVSFSETGILSASERYFFSLAEGHLQEAYTLLDNTLLGEVLGGRIYHVAAPKIQVKEEGEWADYTEAGVHIEIHYDTVLYLLDMDKVKDNKVRIEFWTPGIMIDYITIDYTPDYGLEITELDPDHELLAEIDEKYLIMETGEHVILNYAEPAKAEEERTYFVSFTGYYHPLEDLDEEDVDEPIDPVKADVIYRMILEDGYAEEYLFEVHSLTLP
jgi:hypothetical protein